MSDNRKFHEFALQSILFKGRSDWYFCYLKMEKIAQVLLLLAKEAGSAGAEVNQSGSLSGEIAHLAAGEVDAQVVLAEVFALLGVVRLFAVGGSLALDTCTILIRELEQVAERLVRGSHPSPFVSSEDFTVLPLTEISSAVRSVSLGSIEPLDKGKESKGQYKGQNKRMSLILELIQRKKSLSIKEIGEVIKDCSEKTIQRELNVLIEKGLIRRDGERRWSVYRPI
jgi:hypothetical protein